MTPISGLRLLLISSAHLSSCSHYTFKPPMCLTFFRWLRSILTPTPPALSRKSAPKHRHRGRKPHHYHRSQPGSKAYRTSMAPVATNEAETTVTCGTKPSVKRRHRHDSIASRKAVPLSPAVPADTLIVKIRRNLVSPPQKRTFHLPLTRAISTSAYLLAHIEAPSTRAKDNIVRLNFPDFDIFGIYAEWLRSGDVVTKAALRKTVENAGNDTAIIVQDDSKAKMGTSKQAYQDYLGAYFLATWLQDTIFKDTAVSLIIDTINCDKMGGEAQCFLQALTPTLVNLVLTDARETRGLRRLIYAAIATWGSEEDFARLVPDEGETCERGFVRELLGFLGGRTMRGEEAVEERKKKDTWDGTKQTSREEKGWVEHENGFNGPIEEEEEEAEDEGGWGQTTSHPPSTAPDTTSTASAWTSLSPVKSPDHILAKPPQPWQPAAPGDLWATISHVSWPPSAKSSEAASATSAGWISAASRFEGAGEAYERGKKRGQSEAEGALYVDWPVSEEEHCLFHEHGRLGMKCHRKR